MIGKLWWCAADMKEAEEWKAKYLEKGAISVDLRPVEGDNPPSSVVNVIFTLERNRANEIMGYDVDEYEWLDLSEEVTP